MFRITQASLRSISRQIAALRQRMQREAAARQRSYFTRCQMICTVAVYVLGGHNLAVAVAFALQRRPAAREKITAEALADTIANWYLACSDKQELAFLDPHTDAEKRTRQAALEWLAEHRVHAWVLKQNSCHGVAPSSLEMLTEFAEQCRRLGAHRRLLEAELLLERQGHGARQWSLRFRRRWNIRMGRMKAREPCSPAEISERVTHDSRIGRQECDLHEHSLVNGHRASSFAA